MKRGVSTQAPPTAAMDDLGQSDAPGAPHPLTQCIAGRQRDCVAGRARGARSPPTSDQSFLSPADDLVPDRGENIDDLDTESSSEAVP
jgi:hypothetical protein